MVPSREVESEEDTRLECDTWGEEVTDGAGA